ncbi:reverse transcriptase domain-containing protein [Bosea sp. (in: a-proteobacteria)]|uniref:reverse transcriptase domain-containing protein n=1 Tax=Bosea sp. (in: a-proteobacteria) TaxID=1871050 RepID=UPI0040349170
MDAEMASQHANQTWVLVSRQPGMSVLPGRWVLKVKWGSDGSIVKYKARWVVKGFRQRDGVDYFEDAVFAPVVMHTTQRLIFALAVQKGWGLWQVDFKTAFLNSKLTDSDPQICVEHSLESSSPGHETSCPTKTHWPPQTPGWEAWQPHPSGTKEPHAIMARVNAARG